MDKQRFLLFDETRVRRERLLLFSSDVQLNVLFNSPIIYMDGTFKKTPFPFFQLYVIHAVKFDICKLASFVLLVRDCLLFKVYRLCLVC